MSHGRRGRSPETGSTPWVTFIPGTKGKGLGSRTSPPSFEPLRLKGIGRRGLNLVHEKFYVMDPVVAVVGDP